jgi:ribose transport system substrate-binding protein
MEMESALAVNGRIDLVYGHNDPAAHGAYLAAKAAGRDKDIIFIGIDGLPQEGRIYVEQGLLEASFEYPTGGREAVAAAVKILAGEPVPKQVTLRSHIFTRENLARGGDWLP